MEYYAREKPAQPGAFLNAVLCATSFECAGNPHPHTLRYFFSELSPILLRTNIIW